jgi:hypothetical protein
MEAGRLGLQEFAKKNITPGKNGNFESTSNFEK